MPNPFTCEMMITDASQFFGRSAELARVFARLSASQPGCVNVVGEHRIGRSSLLYHVKQVAPERLAEPERFRLAYIDLQNAAVVSPDTFRAYVLMKLREENGVQPAHLTRVLPDEFEVGLVEIKGANLKPILLLDEFEKLLAQANRDQFDLNFFDGMRALANQQLLSFVIATQKPLAELSLTTEALSTLHGIFAQIALGPLTVSEAWQLLGQNSEWKFNTQQIEFAIKQAEGYHPLKMNLAARQIYDYLEQTRGQWDHTAERAVRQAYRREAARVFSGRLTPDTPLRKASRAVEWAFRHSKAALEWASKDNRWLLTALILLALLFFLGIQWPPLNSVIKALLGIK